MADSGSTVKWLLETTDGKLVETVLMRYRDRTTVCGYEPGRIRDGMHFLHETGDAGFGRHLSTGRDRRTSRRSPPRGAAPSEGWGRLGNVVMMGMGEPLANFGAVWPAVERMNRDLNDGRTASPPSLLSGSCPVSAGQASKALQVNLAVSLHTANDSLRDELVPLATAGIPIAFLIGACELYPLLDRQEDLF